MFSWVSVAHLALLQEDETSRLWEHLQEFARLSKVGYHRAPIEMLLMLEDTHKYAQGKQPRSLHPRDVPMIAHVANWRAFKHYEDPSTYKEDIIRPTEIQVKDPGYLPHAIHWTLEFGIAKAQGSVRADFKKTDPRHSAFSLEIRSRDEDLIQECMEGWYSTQHNGSRNVRAIAPLLREYRHWLKASEKFRDGTTLEFHVGDDS